MADRPLQALFAPAAGPAIGGGHLMRDLALAQALEAYGLSCTFATPPWGERLLQRFAVSPPSIHPLARSGEPKAIAAVLGALAPDLLVLDDYSLAAADIAPLMHPGLRIAVIDDLANRDYACDLLVDPGYGRCGGDYVGRAPSTCEVLTGPSYALLRPEFERLETPAPDAGPVRRAFVSFGLSDVGAIAARAVEALRPRAPHVRFDVALASDAESLPRLQALAAADPGLVVHPDSRGVAALMRAADVAVGAGGSATWERCALGLPTLAVIVADNQRPMVHGMAEAGVLLGIEMAGVDFDGRLARAFDRLCRPEVRASLHIAARSVCDGRGASRVAEALLRLIRC
ncbi:UDP-2,4-diacetamido-2,4,6-trideoxy-beta-L-altropyranose hydrolase [Caulobacter sp. S45]|uniref:UDP-2,4-diacetamido-2,4, 6-trideoxy-beta-L-altropyranose hydrolase n=1 Tax=Caulobacter sp. S45 TaxID=1641861 RepID=UPI001575DA33|nr:UDP-2,4-diacetamido-2,4,6-trideoxy-beta-L-altropyranose hydrolase [Caulobacter sp. S45]